MIGKQGTPKPWVAVSGTHPIVDDGNHEPVSLGVDSDLTPVGQTVSVRVLHSFLDNQIDLALNFGRYLSLGKVERDLDKAPPS